MKTLTLSDQAIAVIIRALFDQPYKDAAPIIADLQRQIKQQQPEINHEPNRTQAEAA